MEYLASKSWRFSFPKYFPSFNLDRIICKVRNNYFLFKVNIPYIIIGFEIKNEMITFQLYLK